jgi:SAM-dependent methyltransferase
LRLLRRAQNWLALVAPHGVCKTASYAIDRAFELYHDWRLGISTAGGRRLEDVGIESPFSINYYPSDYRSLYKAFRRLRIRPHEDAFLDYGCGLGRVLVVAGTFLFRRVIGVELVPEWARIAAENLRRARSELRCPDLQVFQADAAAYPVPADVTLVFFYSPFHGPLLSSALAAIRSSLDQAPRRLRVVFKNTVHLERALKDHSWLVKQDEFSASDGDHNIMILQARM